MSVKRIAVIGAGPIGLEAALYAADLGHDVQVYERGRIGDNVSAWGHVTLFSPFRLNHSTLGARVLEAEDVALPAEETYLTGAEYVEHYLKPLARSTPLARRVHERCAILRIGRSGISKSEPLGPARAGRPFRLLIDGSRGEEVATADVVLDCSGTYGNHNWLGDGNVPALGERRLAERIAYTLEDIRGAARHRYAGRRVMVVGDGYSAATAIADLVELPGTSVLWVSRKDLERPIATIADDPLPERARLTGLANDLADGTKPGVRYLDRTVVEKVEIRGCDLAVTLRDPNGTDSVGVDRILALVGYVPDGAIHRELQVHECYATSGTMNLAAALLADGSADCLDQKPKGPEVLRNPEPDFFILGSKSYGRNSRFLVSLGLEQVREVFTLIEQRPELNRYADESVRRPAAPTRAAQEI